MKPAAQAKLPVKQAAEKALKLIYVNTAGMADPAAQLRTLTDGAGFDDNFVYACRSVRRCGNG